MISEIMKDKVFWTRKMNIKLVKFIENRPNIWNPKHPKYTSIAYRDRTYADFADKYGNEFTGEAVKQRWTNIRSTFSNYLRKFKASRLKTDGEEYKVNWHLWEPCQFLLKVSKKVKTESNLDKDENDIETFSNDSESNIDNTQNEGNSSKADNLETSSTSCEDIANSLLQVFKGVQNDVFGIDKTENGELGRLVAKRLSQMDSFNAAKASARITEVLLLYHKDNPQNPNKDKNK